MKITKVEVRLVHPDYSLAANDNMQKFTGGCVPIMVRIHTDEGIYGDGEIGLGFGTGQMVAVEYAKSLSALLIGRDPLEHDVIWNKLYRIANFHDRYTQSVIAGIDMALWDLKGKFFQVPVVTLLGGAMRTKVRCYASQLQFGWHDSEHMAATPADYAENCKKALADGYDAVKIDFWAYDEEGRSLTNEERKGLISPKYMKMIEERVAAVRDAIGPYNDLILEGHAFTDVVSAVQAARMLEKYNILFFEEPCQVDPESYRRVKESTNMSLGGGERCYTRWEFLPYLQNGSMQVLQPDISNSGGITELMKIASMAETFESVVQGHLCASPLSLAATLHFECAIPNFAIHEYHVEGYQPYIKNLCTKTFIPKDGYLELPEGNGLGTELSEYSLTHCNLYTVE